jgi:acetoacetyl-CoA reductase/3-oxoacyl-[acyl-carrier protein] reductase
MDGFSPSAYTECSSKKTPCAMHAGAIGDETEGTTMARLAGKFALVTGASRGIGRAIAIALAQEGAAVAVNYRVSEREARRVVEELSALGVKTMLAPANVSNGAEMREMVQRVVKAWGRIDVMVNCAGITRDKSLRKMTDEDWFEVINTNLNSVYYGVMAVMPLMIEQQFGRIINISSFVGQAGNFGQANYSASKGGIIAFTKTAAIELAKYNITVNALAPGFTLTDMLAKVPENVQEQIKSRIPMGRFGMPEEMAKAVLFLAADADYVTGQQINVNGGVYM